jgi:two-component system sensor histidine kinase KdpD
MRELRARLGPGDAPPGPLVLLRRREERGRLVAGYVVALAGAALAFAIFLLFRDQISPLSKGFGFLAVVVAAAAVGGLGPGVAAAALGFVLFNFFFIPPYGTFRIDRSEDVVVLFVFLALSVIISVLLARATERAEVAEARRNELEAIQWLSTELVAMRPGPDAYRTVLERVVSLFDCSSATLSLQRVAEFRGLQEAATVRSDPIRPLGTFEERVPLAVGGRNLGLLLLQGNRGDLIAPEQRVLMAFAAQLSLMLERDRILAAAVRAQTDPGHIVT